MTFVGDMESVEQTVTTERDSIVTPIKVVLVGSVMAVMEGIYDIVNAGSYAGIVDGIEVTAMEIVVITAIAVLLALGMILYAYTKRYAPTKETYLILGMLSVATLVIGVLFTAAIALLGAVIGYWETR